MRRTSPFRSRTALAAVLAGALVPALAGTASAGTRQPDITRYTASNHSAAKAARVPATTCQPLAPDDGSDAVADVDGDDRNDLAVGEPLSTLRPGLNDGDGALEVLMSTAGTQRLLDASFGGEEGTTTDDAFGSAIALSDLDHDLCGDLVVGAPGDSFVHGHVAVLHGSPLGVTATPSELLTAPTPANGDQFGAAVAVSRQQGGGASVLWVGAPGSTVGGVVGAGAVYQYIVSTNGTIELNQRVTEDTVGVGLTPATGDHFGQVLSAEGDGSVTVGVPLRDVDGQKNAGVVIHLETSYSAVPISHAQVLSQNTAGVPGSAETGDHFGAAVDGGGATVGVPGEDIGRVKDAGAIQTFTWTDATPALLTPTASYDQGSAGVPGVSEAGDHFGAALASGFGVVCHEVGALLVGVPGEDVGHAKDAGAVVVMPAKEQALSCRGRSLSQSGTLPGTAEPGDEVGAALSTVPDQEGLDEDTSDSVLIGAPGEDIGSVKDAGEVQWFFGSGTADFTSVSGPVKGLRFGAVLGQYVAGTVN